MADDGTPIAVDVHLPKAASGPLPTVLRPTRYFRGIDFRAAFRHLPVRWLLDHVVEARQAFLNAGYAWVDVCVRGSGASFGSRQFPWSRPENEDGHTIIDWVHKQPWCNGKVGATGVSYDGTASEMWLRKPHPALLAIAPRFSLYDVYTNVAFPGGIHLAYFTRRWNQFNQHLDQNNLHEAFALMMRIQLQALRATETGSSTLASLVLGLIDNDGAQRASQVLVRLMARGVLPVSGSEERLAAALACHLANVDVHAGAERVVCRDDDGVAPADPTATIDTFSPHIGAALVRNTEVAIYGTSGWLDGAYQRGALDRFTAIGGPDSRVTIGPWDHGGLQNVSPFSPSRTAAFDQNEDLIGFFDQHLKGAAPIHDAKVRYFVMGAEEWRSASVWPPHDRGQFLYLDRGRQLATAPPTDHGHDRFAVDPSDGTGRRSRWVSLLGLLPPVGYNDRKKGQRRRMVYRSAPILTPWRLVGTPAVRLTLTPSGDDPHIFVYLEQESRSGAVRYVTEGQLRARHRSKRKEGQTEPSDQQRPHTARTFKRSDMAPLSVSEPTTVAFDLLPIAWEFEVGDRIRISMTGADCDHFRVGSTTESITFHRGGANGSCIWLPRD